MDAPQIAARVRKLADYTLNKRGTQPIYGPSPDFYNRPQVILAGLTSCSLLNYWDQVRDDNQPFVSTELSTESVIRLSRAFPGVHAMPGWPAKNGVTTVIIPLDGSVSDAVVQGAIDEAYHAAMERLGRMGRLKLDLAEANLRCEQIIERLIVAHDLEHEADAIRALARPAVLLTTPDADRSKKKLPCAVSKLGGQPDLPPRQPWPTYQGTALPFVAQLNLSDMALFGHVLPGLPKTGLLSVFTLWARWDEEEGQSAVPTEEVDGLQEGWTVVLHHPVDAVQARRTPAGVPELGEAGLQGTFFYSLPNHEQDHSGAALKWSKKVRERFDVLQSDYREVLMYRHLGNMSWCQSYHQLGGYALFVNYFPKYLVGKSACMLLQVGTDDQVGSMWGDGGELTVYVDTPPLKQGRFEGMWCEAVGG